MARPYSADLRERVLLACERGRLSRASIAAQFRIGEATVYRWLQEVRAEGRRAAKPHAGGPAARLDEAALGTLRALVQEANDLTLEEHAAQLAERAGPRVSAPTVCRALRRLGLVRKQRRSGRPSRTVPTSPRRARLGAPSWPRSIPPASSSSTRAASTPA
jgi:transposase